MAWIHELAPNGILRVCINTGNALLAQQDPHTHELRGISVMLAERLAHTHKLQLQTVLVTTAKPPVPPPQASKGTTRLTPGMASAV